MLTEQNFENSASSLEEGSKARLLCERALETFASSLQQNLRYFDGLINYKVGALCGRVGPNCAIKITERNAKRNSRRK